MKKYSYERKVGTMTAEDVKKWMRMAFFVKENESSCYSRDIGCIIVDPFTNCLVSSGHNGFPKNSKPCDDYYYLRNVVWPQLDSNEKSYLFPKDWKEPDKELQNRFARENAGCKICPRKLVNAPSSKRLELCTCIHGEVSTILNAHRSVVNCVIFCGCSVPCLDCCKVIIDSGISDVFALFKKEEDDYNRWSSRWVLESSGVHLHLLKESEFE